MNIITDKKTAIIALGSNLGNRLLIMQAALQKIRAHPKIYYLKHSSFYLTEPVDCPKPQQDYINAVCLIHTSLTAISLLSLLQSLEQEFKRERLIKNGPRTLDLDLIDFAGMVSDYPHLILPHPRAVTRAFVMLPLAEICPDFSFDRHNSAKEIAIQLQTTRGPSVKRLCLNNLLKFS
jgi:2-amino-4-hydroxy-6-hydroxymethyldihydropteridine diphosphokinase